MNRRQLLQKLQILGREHIAKAVMFHQAIGDQLDLSATEARCLDYISRYQGITAGELADYSGLTTASITALVDRLEEREYVKRLSHPTDRRKVILSLNRAAIAPRLEHIYDRVGREWRVLCERYDEEQLAFISDFIEKTIAMTQDLLVEMKQGRTSKSNERRK